MYIPRHFEMTPAQATELLASAETIQLVTAHETGPVATLLPAGFAAYIKRGGFAKSQKPAEASGKPDAQAPAENAPAAWP